MSTSRNYNRHDDYWKLEHYRMHSEWRMRELLMERHQHVARNADKQMLRTLLERSDRGFLDYETYSNEDLISFVTARGIDAPDVINRPRREHRSELLDVLERADKNPRFVRFMDLPPELRNTVYQYYLEGFRGPIYAPTQPPLSKVSRVLRRELLPLFYTTCEFRIGFTRFTRRVAGSVRQVLGSDMQQLGFLQNTPFAYFASIRRLDLEVVPDSQHMHVPSDMLDQRIKMKISLPHEGRKYNLQCSTQPDVPDAKPPTARLMEQVQVVMGGVRDVLDSIVERTGKDRLRVEDVSAIRQAVYRGYNLRR